MTDSVDPAKAGLPVQGMERDRPEGVDVGRRTHSCTFELFGGRVVRRAQVPLRLGQRSTGGEVPDEPEVGEVGAPAIPGQQDVARLDVAVDQAGPVGDVERIGHLAHDRSHCLHRKDALLVDPGLEVAALDESHGDVQVALVLAGVVDRDDVRVMPQIRPRRATRGRTVPGRPDRS